MGGDLSVSCSQSYLALNLSRRIHPLGKAKGKGKGGGGGGGGGGKAVDISDLDVDLSDTDAVLASVITAMDKSLSKIKVGEVSADLLDEIM